MLYKDAFIGLAPTLFLQCHGQERIASFFRDLNRKFCDKMPDLLVDSQAGINRPLSQCLIRARISTIKLIYD